MKVGKGGIGIRDLLGLAEREKRREARANHLSFVFVCHSGDTV